MVQLSAKDDQWLIEGMYHDKLLIEARAVDNPLRELQTNKDY